jgi:hypothetical protein
MAGQRHGADARRTRSHAGPAGVPSYQFAGMAAAPRAARAARPRRCDAGGRRASVRGSWPLGVAVGHAAPRCMPAARAACRSLAESPTITRSGGTATPSWAQARLGAWGRACGARRCRRPRPAARYRAAGPRALPAEPAREAVVLVRDHGQRQAQALARCRRPSFTPPSNTN